MNRTEGTFETADGLALFERSWLPEGEPKATVVIVHGFAEHSGRYDHIAGRLAGAGYAVYAYDLRGHGRSPGRRSYVRSLDEHVDDLRTFLARVRERQPGGRRFLLGHSMGGTIVARYLTSDGRDADAVVLSAPVLKLKLGPLGILRWIALALGRLFPRLPLGKLNSADISRDPAVAAAYDSDPLVYRGRIRAGMAAAMVKAVRAIEERMDAIDLPLLLLHGSADALAEPDGSKALYARARATDKTLKLYDGLYHEIMNEPEKEQVIADIISWLDAHAG